MTAENKTNNKNKMKAKKAEKGNQPNGSARKLPKNIKLTKRENGMYLITMRYRGGVHYLTTNTTNREEAEAEAGVFRGFVEAVVSAEEKEGGPIDIEPFAKKLQADITSLKSAKNG